MIVLINLSALSFPYIINLSLVVYALPLLSWLGLVLLKKKQKRWLGWLTMLLISIAAGFSFYIFSKTEQGAIFHGQWHWFSLPTHQASLSFSVGIYLDFITAWMLCLVLFISGLVCFYSLDFMKNDTRYNYYFVYLSTFIVAMAGLIVADNLLVLFMFWELVSFISYLFIGFWYQEAKNAQASQKVFLINKLGSIAFLIGLCLLWNELGTFDLATLQKRMCVDNAFTIHPGLSLAGLCFFCGIVAKSAQFPLLHWLPSAMAAPTPISALLHGATMVPVGIYIFLRMAIFCSPSAFPWVAFTGAFTACIGAYAALKQHDMKQMLAYSTISHIGYMFMAMGVGAYEAGFFHLTTHALGKACLFLYVGAVVYGIRKGNGKTQVNMMYLMGSLRKKKPLVFYAWIIAMLSLMGIPYFSVFLSKGAVLTSTVALALAHTHKGHWWYGMMPVLGFATVLLTVLYMSRSVVFIWRCSMLHRSKNCNVQAENFPVKNIGLANRSMPLPWRMQVSIVVLALLSLGIFYNAASLNYNDSWLFQYFAWATQTQKTNFLPTLPLAIGQATLQRWVGSGSLLLIVIGLISLIKPWHFFVAYKQCAPLKHYNNFSTHAYDSVWLNAITAMLSKKWMELSQAAAYFDQNLLGWANITGKIYVVVGHIVAWIDHVCVDGVVHLFYIIFVWINHQLKAIHNQNTQKYILWTIILFFLFFVIFFYINID